MRHGQKKVLVEADADKPCTLITITTELPTANGIAHLHDTREAIGPDTKRQRLVMTNLGTREQVTTHRYWRRLSRESTIMDEDEGVSDNEDDD